MFRITTAWIHAHKTPAGGWKRAQLQHIRVEWPPVAGWADRVSGHEITDEARLAFESYSVNDFAPVWPASREAQP